MYRKFYTITDMDWILGQIRDVNIKELEFDNFKFNVSSIRLRTFAEHGIDCICCGAKGDHFVAETTSKRNDYLLHINLYAKDKDGELVLMTRDHIVPRSSGGSDTLQNMSPMCAKCNSARGNFNDQLAFIIAYRSGNFNTKTKMIEY